MRKASRTDSVGTIRDDSVMDGPTELHVVRPEPGGARVVRFRTWLAGAMWFPVLVANVLAIALGITLPFLDDILGDRAALPLSLSAVEQILGALVAGMITFTGIVFSAVLVAAQLQTSAYSPRLAARLRRDPIVIAGLALPTATASYAMFALGSIGREANESGEPVASALTLGVALLLAVATFGGFIALVQRALDSTQIGGIFRAIVRRTDHVIRDMHPVSGETAELAHRAEETLPVVDITHSGPPGVLASIDRAALVELARRSDAFVEVAPMVGQYISPGTVVLTLRGAEREQAPDLTRRVLVLARQRTIDQDPAFGIRMLVDIAIRALSPAINDPTTAVQALDRIETLLLELYRRRPGPTIVADVDGEPRGLVLAPTWEHYADLALTEIRRYGGGSIQVVRRLHALYAHLLEVVEGPARDRVEHERRLLLEELPAHFPDSRERELASRPDRLGLGSAD